MNPLKNWIVGALILGFYDGDRGLKYWMALSARHLWGGGFKYA